MIRKSNKEVLPELRSVYARRGVRGAVEFLNSLTPHRFTSLFRFDGDILHNLTFFDRENPNADRCEDIPVDASYCVFIRNSGNLFKTEDSQQDDRVRDHAKRDAVQCYCGVPLVDRYGTLFGTICHFDFKPGRISEMDVELMEFMAHLLQEEPSFVSGEASAPSL